MVQVVLPNDANPLGFILGGTVMHLIDIAAAIACHRHTRSLLVTAAVDGLQFLHPIKVGDLIILKARVTCAFYHVARSAGRCVLGGNADGHATADQPRVSDVRGDLRKTARGCRCRRCCSKPTTSGACARRRRPAASSG